MNVLTSVNYNSRDASMQPLSDMMLYLALADNKRVLFSTVGSSGMDVIYIHAQQGTNNVTALRIFLFLEKNACFLNLYRKLTAIQCSVYID